MSHRSENRKGVKISIIIPVYNVAPYIGDCLRSVMRQTYAGSMECLLVDDCSEDDSMAIAEGMIEGYDGTIQFRILHHERNRGLSVARNTGTMQATGDFLYYLDSDDDISNDCIERLLEKMMEDPHTEMVQGNTQILQYLNHADRLIKSLRINNTTNNDEARKCFYKYNQMRVAVWNKLIKRDFILKNKLLCPEGLIHEDYIWSFNLLKYINKVSFIPAITYHYRVRPDSIVTGSDSKTHCHSYGFIFRYILDNLTPGHEEEEFSYYARMLGRVLVRFGYETPELKDVVLSYREHSKKYAGWLLRMRLAGCLVLCKSRYGRIVYRIINKLMHPTQIPQAVQSLLLKH